MEWRRPVQLRRWQTEALVAWKVKSKGIIKVVTGGGKTIFAETAIKDFLDRYPDGKILICVPSISLLDQWFVSLKEDFKISDSDISLKSSTDIESDFKKINIGVVNSLRKVRKFPRPAMLVVDECHRVASEENQKIFDNFFDATLGLSATPDRPYDRGLEDVLIPELGPIIYNYGLAEALKDGVVCAFSAVNVQIDFLEDEKTEFEELSRKAARALRKFEATGQGEQSLKHILINRARVCATASMREPYTVLLCEKHESEKIIVFHESVKSADRIYKALINRGISAGIYHSKISAVTRRDNLRLFRRGNFRVLVSCRALDEGINVPEASVGVIASGTASDRQRIQRLGRVLRPSPGKDGATVYTIFITKGERARLEKEEIGLQGLTKFSWLTGTQKSVKSD